MIPVGFALHFVEIPVDVAEADGGVKRLAPSLFTPPFLVLRQFFKGTVGSGPIVNAGFSGLRMLIFPQNAVQFSVFDEVGTGLVEPEGDILPHTLLSQVQNPIVVAGAGPNARFAAHRDLFNAAVQIGFKVYAFQKRGGNDRFVPDGQGAEYGQAVVCS